MKKIVYSLVLSLVLASCSNNDETITLTTNPETTVPTISANAIYDVTIVSDIIYAEGLSHESVNSANSTRMPLELDLYVPNNDSENRPVFMFIHGGGFTGGDKQGGNIFALANYYTSRGFVFASINYRLLNDFGSIPQAWEATTSFVDPNQVPQYYAIYPAQRDAKAALRWIVANAETYNINTDYITVGGGSAGAITAITLGISNEEDFRDEFDIITDPTLSTTNLNQTYTIQTIVDFWGSKVALDAYEEVYGVNRFDANDPSLFIAHGTLDPTVLYSSATDLETIYQNNGVPYILYTLEGAGHGVWNATVDGKSLSELSFDYVVEQQGLELE